jgi:ABC-type uncharacterized transport system substrate-binding protein
MAAAHRQDPGHDRLRRRAAALVLAIAATLAVPAPAAPRILLYATDDTPQLRAAKAGVREALGAVPVDEVPAGDAGASLRAAAREGGDAAAVITLGQQAATQAAREAPTLAIVDCASAQPAAAVQTVPVAITFDQQIGWLRRLLTDARYIGVLYDPAQNDTVVDALAAALRPPPRSALCDRSRGTRRERSPAQPPAPRRHRRSPRSWSSGATRTISAP